MEISIRLEAEEDKWLNDIFIMEHAAKEELPAMDLDLDDFWSFDQLIFSSDPSPSCILSAPEQSLSPLLVLSDDSNTIKNSGDGNQAGNDTLTSSGAAHRLLSEFASEIGLGYARYWVVNPHEYQEATCMERMLMALDYLKELGEKHVLLQVWAPVKDNGRIVLTTCGQPFILGPNCTGLHQYRMAPNVQFNSDKEYQRLDHALSYDVRGTLALPVFEPSGKSCIGVFELILTSQKINYALEIDKVWKALEAVNLRSSRILDSSNMQKCNESRQQALTEILEVMAAACETFNFPLAQTWVPIPCSSFDGSCMGQVCMSTTDVAFYVVDPHM